MSQFVVSARKYRPQIFDEVVGQNHVAHTLKNALTTNQLAHAFLFCGPRGVGKTTCARILAKVLNCTDLQNEVNPCNACSSCKSFNDNASFNIIELDAASNNSVEHIRNLIEQVRFQPQQGTHKVFIIDEVHMLSSQAFNAFLKTLEEPPPYAIFILATTEKHKILPTILSRCQIFDFKRIQNEEIVQQLERIAEKEEIKFEPEALHIIAQKSDGAMRDALSIFDKIVSSTNKNVTYTSVIENLNILDFEYFFKLTNAFLQEDFPEVMTLFEEISKKGFDPELALQGLAEHLREILIAKNPKTLPLLNVSSELQKRYLDQAQLSGVSFLMGALHILNQCDVNFLRAKNKRLHAEIALGKITYLSRARTITRHNEEKKTENLTQSSPPATTSQKTALAAAPKVTRDNPSKSMVSKPAVGKSIENVVQPSTTSDVKSSTPPIQKVVATTVSKTKKKDSFLNIGFSSDDQLSQKIADEEALKENKLKALDLEVVKKIWDNYVSNHHSPSVKTALKVKKIQVEGKKINVFVPSSGVLKTINQEENLLVKIRQKFDIDDLEFIPIVDLEKFPEHQKFVPKKVLSPKEKYEHMVAQNPALLEMKEKFDLEVDKD